LTSFGHLSVLAACSTVLAQARYRLGEVHTVVVALALAVGGLCGLGATLLFPVLGASLLPGVPYEYLLVALLLTPLTIYQACWNYMMMGLNRLVLLNKLNLAVNTLSALLMILIVGVFQAGIPGFLVVWGVSACAGTGAALVLAARLDRFAWPPNRALARELLHF